MSRFVRQSLVRNLVVESYPVDQSYMEIDAGDIQSYGNLISCSSKYLAFTTSHNGSSSVGVLNVNYTGKQAGYSYSSCQQNGVYDVAFSPHDPAVFATGAGDGTIAIWAVQDGDESQVAVNFDVKHVLATGGRERVQAARWHPSAGGVLAGLCGEEVLVWDTYHPEDQLFNVEIGSKMIDGCWGHDGSYIACFAEDKALRMIDPRTGEVQATVDGAHQGRGPCRVVCGGATEHGELQHFLYSTGFSMTRDREFAVWDSRNLTNCVSRTKIGSGSGVMLPLVVPDVKVIFLVGKGETSIRSMEGVPDSPYVHNINTTVTSANPFLGVAALPVPACDLMGCEVSRLFKLSSNMIETFKVEIPRRLKQTFHEELFPPTADIHNPAMTAAEWASGKNEKQEMVSVRTAYQQRKHDEGVAAVAQFDDTPDQKEPEEQVVEEEEQEYVESAMDKRMSRMMGYIPKFKYARGVQVKKDDTIYNMQPGNPVALSVSDNKFAVTWQGGGGPVYVGSLTDTGKIDAPASVPVINGHKKAVFCVEFNPFDENVLATGSDDCHIKIWSVNDGGEEQANLLGHQSSVRMMSWHPSVSSIMVSGSQDYTVRLWDINRSTELATILQTEQVLTGLGWNYDGSLNVTMDRENKMSILDPRNPNAQVMSVEKSHQGAKPCNVVWLGDSPNILTSGCARMGYREFSIWDSRSLDKPINSTKVGTGAVSLEPLYIEDNGVVIFIARGENTFYVYEIQGLMKTNVKPAHFNSDPLKPHSCNEFIASGDPTSCVALAPRRVCDVNKTEFAKVFRLTPSALEPVSFTIPRANDLVEYFADDVYCDTRSGQPSSLSSEEWYQGTENYAPTLMSMNMENKPLLSERDPTLAHAAMKRAQANTDRFRQQQREEEERQKEQHNAFARMQQLAVQHEAYNPNLSTGGVSHDQARQLGIAVPDEQVEQEVADDEWDD